LKDLGITEAFLPVAAPASVIPDRKNEYYKSEEDLIRAIGAAMRTEYCMIIDAGFVLQLDDARAAVTYDRMVPPASFAEYRKWLALQVDVLNEAIAGLPVDRIRYHVCWGSWPGPHYQRRRAQRHRRSHLGHEGRRLCHRGRQSASRARMAGVENGQIAGRPTAYSGRHQSCH
jgi:methionine synthase II (cobalamin-independent)